MGREADAARGYEFLEVFESLFSSKGHCRGPQIEFILLHWFVGIASIPTSKFWLTSNHSTFGLFQPNRTNTLKVEDVDQIRVPMLIGQGANDPRVNIKNSDVIVAALRKRNIPVTYIVYTDEGHGFARPENKLDFFGRAEDFLAKYLNGRCEPWAKIPGSTAEIH